MVKKIKIFVSGFCPEITRGGYKKLEDIMNIQPRILDMEKENTIVSIAKGVKRGRIFKNKYILITSGEDIRLEFLNKHGNDVYLGLPRPYGWGKEILEKKDTEYQS